MKYTITLFAICITLISYSQDPIFEWVKHFGSDGYNEAFAMTSDNNGDILITGWFDGTMDFDPSSDVYNLTTTETTDMFIVKLDSDGNFIWAIQNGGIGFGYSGGFDIITDDSGNIYTTGLFNSNVDFDPSSTTESLIGTNDDIFIQKLDSDGNLLWVKEMDGSNYERGHAIELDNSNNVYITGWFSGTVDFDPSSNVFELVTSNGPQDIYIAKYSSDGNFEWAKHIEGAGINDDVGSAISVDSNANVYITGVFNGSTDFDPGSNTFYLSPNTGSANNMFILKLNSNGEFVWAKKVEGSNNNSIGSDMVIDSANNLIITGSFSDTVDFNPGNAIENLTSSVGIDKYILKLDLNGNFIWVRQISDELTSFFYISYETSVTLDNSDNIYLTGKFSGTIDFDSNTSEDDLNSNGGEDIFISEFNSNGDFIWAKQMGGTSNEQGLSLIVDDLGNIYTTGAFEGTVDFDPGVGTENLTSMGSRDIFIQKLSNDNLNVDDVNKSFNAKIYPNPSDNTFSIKLPSIQPSIEVKVIDNIGKVIHSSHYFNTDLISLDIDVNAGIYFIELKASENKNVLPLIKK